MCIRDRSKATKKVGFFKKVSSKVNIYVVILLAVVIMATTIIAIAVIQSQSPSASSNLKPQPLDQATLQQLATSDATVGSSQYILNIQSNAIFAGQVVMRQSLEVAGNLQVGGTAAVNNINVAGTAQFGQASINNNLSIGQNASIQGAVTIAKSLQVTQGASFGGAVTTPQLTTTNLELNGNLVIQHHIVAGGAIPVASPGIAVGNGGSVSLSGSDTAGSVNINNGTNTQTGCFVTVTFKQPYDTIPHVIVTPVGPGAAGVPYYITRTITNFSICDGSPPHASTSLGFDFFVID